MSEPLSGYEDWASDMEGKNDMFKGRSMIVFHQILNQFAVCFLSFAFLSIGHPCRTDNGHIVTHRINKTDKAVINWENVTHSQRPRSFIHEAGDFTCTLVGHGCPAPDLQMK